MNEWMMSNTSGGKGTIGVEHEEPLRSPNVVRAISTVLHTSSLPTVWKFTPENRVGAGRTALWTSRSSNSDYDERG